MSAFSSLALIEPQDGPQSQEPIASEKTSMFLFPYIIFICYVYFHYHHIFQRQMVPFFPPILMDTWI